MRPPANEGLAQGVGVGVGVSVGRGGVGAREDVAICVCRLDESIRIFFAFLFGAKRIAELNFAPVCLVVLIILNIFSACNRNTVTRCMRQRFRIPTIASIASEIGNRYG